MVLGLPSERFGAELSAIPSPEPLSHYESVEIPRHRRHSSCDPSKAGGIPSWLSGSVPRLTPTDQTVE